MTRMGTDKCKKQIRHSNLLLSVSISAIRGKFFSKTLRNYGILEQLCRKTGLFRRFKGLKVYATMAELARL